MEQSNVLAVQKRRVLAVCVAAYTVSYLLRTNLSLALEDLMEVLSIGRGQAGLVSTLYFWTYASGQLLGGWLSVKWDPKRVVALGLAASGLCNLAIGFCSGYWTLAALWTVNGLALALFWPPILQITTNWFEPSEYLKVSILLSLPTTLGYLVAWSGLGAVLRAAGWRWVFFCPAIIAFCFFWVWLRGLKSSPRAAGLCYRPASLAAPAKKEEPVGPRQRGSLMRAMLTLPMLSFAFVILAQGSTKESINLWAPTLLQQLAGPGQEGLVGLFTAVIPLFSTAGLLATGWLVRRLHGGQEGALLALTGAGAVCGWLLVALQNSLAGLVVCLGLLLGLVYGVTTILTTLLPLRFARTGQSAAFTGIFNFLAYVGAALGGALSGWVSDLWGWQQVYLLWAALATVSALALFVSEAWQYFSWRYLGR